MVEIPGIRVRELHRRRDFLLCRAAAHTAMVTDEGHHEDLLHRACAATLQRDAACIAFLAGKTVQAKNLCWKAGVRFAKLDLAVGASLMALASPKETLAWLKEPDRAGGVLSQQLALDRVEKSDRKNVAMADETSVSVRQLFSLYQCALLLIHLEEGPFEAASKLMSKALPNCGGYPAGETGISIARYVGIAEWLVACHRAESDGPAPQSVARSLRTMGDSRREHIRVAQADTFHWKLLLMPAELVAPDLLAFFCLARNLKLDLELLAQSLWQDGADAINRAPMAVALDLTRAASADPSLQPRQQVTPGPEADPA